ncbi:hypothetical protein PspLS_10664 [Pyricularia sp. CBS 133598]|nr:hypothetical protein PspLS_10664 [Pyricularia sp. CBS 133598]
MWLIYVETRQLEEFSSGTPPYYSILSHTWVEGNEVTDQEMKAVGGQQPAGSIKNGSGTCVQAARDGYKYAWVDTCCIDKTSSAQLTEAINSMFQWYKRTAVCDVFLPDLALPASALESTDQVRISIEPCRWSTRAWTLHELVAPLNVKFFNRDWELSFTKATALAVLARITGINHGILRHERDLREASVAQRMAGAATRQSTRIEDAAYSLLGIFEINMPSLYGEGERAFLRLQAEIIGGYPDTTILAWVLPDNHKTSFGRLSGLDMVKQ